MTNSKLQITNKLPAWPAASPRGEPAGRQIINYKRLKPGAILFLLILFLAGCGRVSESTLSSILEKDPSFAKALDEKKQIDLKISSLKDSFSKEKDATIRKIQSLKDELNAKKDNLNKDILLFKREMEPVIQGFKSELEGKKTDYKLKAKELSEAISKAKNIQKLLERKSELSLSGDEISIWNQRVARLQREISSLQKDLDAARNKIYILKTEIKILEE